MNQETKMPLIRLAKRDSMDPKRVWAIRLGSIPVSYTHLTLPTT